MECLNILITFLWSVIATLMHRDFKKKYFSTLTKASVFLLPISSHHVIAYDGTRRVLNDGGTVGTGNKALPFVCISSFPYVFRYSLVKVVHDFLLLRASGNVLKCFVSSHQHRLDPKLKITQRRRIALRYVYIWYVHIQCTPGLRGRNLAYPTGFFMGLCLLITFAWRHSQKPNRFFFFFPYSFFFFFEHWISRLKSNEEMSRSVLELMEFRWRVLNSRFPFFSIIAKEIKTKIVINSVLGIEHLRKQPVAG